MLIENEGFLYLEKWHTSQTKDEKGIRELSIWCNTCNLYEEWWLRLKCHKLCLLTIEE